MSRQKYKHQRNNRTYSKLAFEALEDRTLLAGNVVASISGGALRLVGDSAGNQVRVEQVSASSVLLTPLDGTTTINGTAGPVTLNGFRSGVALAAGAGDDVFLFEGTNGAFQMGNVVNWNLGDGNDTLEISNAITRVLILNAGDGNDRVDLRNNAYLYVSVLIGGRGVDTLNSVGNNFRHGPVVTQFEQRTRIEGPIALADSATVSEGGTVTINAAANDQQTGAALDLDSIVITSQPANGTATANADGTVTYVHNGSDTTRDSFRYTIADVNGQASAEATISLNITSTNDPPTIGAVADLTTNVNVATGPISVTLADDNTAAAQIGLTAGSSNTTLVPNANIAIAGTGSTRTVVVTPAANQTGTATITLTATDGNSATATETFIVTVSGPPTISDVVDATIDEDAAAGPFNFTIGDDLTAAGSLVLSATSSNSTLVPNANIQLGGSGSARTVLVTPAANASGTATITLTVTDAGGLTATDTFTVTVNPTNDSPTIGAVADVTTNVSTQAGPLNVTIADQETAAGSLVLTAVSSNQAVVTDGGIQLGGSAGARTVLVTPVAGATGTATITLTVTDESNATATETFVVSVSGAPTISDVANATIDAGAQAGPFNVTVGDDLTAAGSLTLTAASSNTALLPNANITLGGSGSARTVLLTPLAGVSGDTTITLTVTDAGGLTATDTFTLIVNPVGNAAIAAPVAASPAEGEASAAAVDQVLAERSFADELRAIIAQIRARDQHGVAGLRRLLLGTM
jgi:hypothetical protein